MKNTLLAHRAEHEADEAGAASRADDEEISVVRSVEKRSGRWARRQDGLDGLQPGGSSHRSCLGNDRSGAVVSILEHRR